MSSTRILRIAFHNQGNIYEFHALKVHQSNRYALVQNEEIIFGERSSVVATPSEEELKTGFTGVLCTYIPLQPVIRIGEVEREGGNRIISAGDNHRGKLHPPPPAGPTNRQAAGLATERHCLPARQ
jgi:hypothetical protein